MDQLNYNNPLIGDPNDRRLRSVEKEILIPKIMRDITKNEKCLAESQGLFAETQDSWILMNGFRVF